MSLDATFWATVALALFLILVVYLKIPAQITGMLDARIKKIQDDLDEAKRLREEAQALLAEYERKRKSADDEAASIIEAAHEEAKRLTEEATQSLEELVTRRTRAVEEKIGQAESQAVGEVRARSADIAVEAARLVLEEQMAEKSGDLIDQSIKDVSARLN